MLLSVGHGMKSRLSYEIWVTVHGVHPPSITATLLITNNTIVYRQLQYPNELSFLFSREQCGYVIEGGMQILKLSVRFH